MSAPRAQSTTVNDGRELGVLRRMTLGTVIVILVQSAIGMAVNLYVTIPAHHPGAHPSEYFTGSARSIGWVMAHGAIVLVTHAVLGFLLVVMVVNTVIRLWKRGRPSINAWAIVGAVFVIGAGFNGASFLDFANTISSLIMALLALSSSACYVVVLWLLSTPTSGAAVSASA
jgi:hypothetical protein